MNVLDALLLGIIQGVTEFLPISSSGHLVLVESLLNLPVSKLVVFDVTAHVGTLVALVLYFWKDIKQICLTIFYSLFARKLESNSRTRTLKLTLYLVVATLPAVFTALLFQNALESFFRESFFVGLWMIVLGFAYLIIEYFSSPRYNEVISWKQALLIGISQAIALLPGVSRSGSTISAGLLTGLKRYEAARFSFLLGIIAIFGAFVFKLPDLLSIKDTSLSFAPLIVGFVSSSVSGFFSISFLIKFLKTHSLRAFALYLIVVGGLVMYLLTD